jgi:hypothetical protein
MVATSLSDVRKSVSGFSLRHRDQAKIEETLAPQRAFM